MLALLFGKSDACLLLSLSVNPQMSKIFFTYESIPWMEQGRIFYYRCGKTASYIEECAAWSTFLGSRQFPLVVLTMKKSILIVGHELEIVWKNQVIAVGYSLDLCIPIGLLHRKGDTGG